MGLARTAAVFFPSDHLARAARALLLGFLEKWAAAVSLASALALLSGAREVSSTSIAFRPALVIRREYGWLSSPRRQTGMSSVARSSSRSFSLNKLSTTLFAALPLRFAGNTVAWSARCEAEDRIINCVSESFIKSSLSHAGDHRRHDRDPTEGASARRGGGPKGERKSALLTDPVDQARGI